jgi:hypothetical protein
VPNGSPIFASFSATISIGNATQLLVGLVFPGLTFGAAVSGADTATLTFQENYSTAFGIRIIPKTGPFTLTRQDIPGEVYITESQFTPCFSFGHCSTPPSGPIGLATSGTQLLSRMKKLGSAAASVSVPNFVVSSSGQLAAYLIVDGKPAGGAGNSSVTVTAGSVDILYEVAEYNGSGGGYTIDTFTVPAALPARRWRTPRRPYSTATSRPSTPRTRPVQRRQGRASLPKQSVEQVRHKLA